MSVQLAADWPGDTDVLQDYDERIVYDVGWVGSGNYWHWPAKIYPYIKNAQIFACPSTSRSSVPVYASPPGGNSWWFPPEFSNSRQCSYGLNYYLRGQKLGDVRLPAESFIVADNAHPIHSCGSPQYRIAYAQVCQAQSCRPDNRQEQYTRHNSGENICYLDGHVKWLNYQNIIQVSTGGCHAPFNGRP